MASRVSTGVHNVVKQTFQYLRPIALTLVLLVLGVLILGGCTPSPTVQPDFPSESPRGAAAKPPHGPEQTADRSNANNGLRHDLSKDEERGGHTLEKHVGRSDGELRERLERERNISAASTWTDRAAAEETIGEALQSDQAQIARWEGRGERRPNLALHYSTSRVIGRSMRHGDSTSSPCTQAVIVLKADGPDGFYVLTAYPEDRQ